MKVKLGLIGLIIFLLISTMGIFWVVEKDPAKQDESIVIESVKQKRIPETKQPKTARDLVGQSIGDVPDTGLVTHNGNPFKFEELPETPLLLSFIFTRCPDRQMCPLVTRKMSKIKKNINKKFEQKVNLISITMDPEYDTPAVLVKHAKSRGLDLTNWSFVTGPLSVIKIVEDWFQISVLRKNGRLRTHNMRTYVIDSDHKIRKVFYGSDWSRDEVMEAIIEASG